jgi:uncharacterized phage protein (TIGR01671 family)
MIAMRKILFRGKQVDNGEWVYGYLYITHDGEYEISCYDSETNIERITYIVVPETVGQFTGLTDKSGKKIFEGDIGWDCHNECYGVVEFSDGKFSYVWENICTDLYEVSNDVDFIGNIHDNPELLGDST